MQALVLAGGQGTRLRPLTLDVPKPVIPLAGRPFLSYMLDWLEDHGLGCLAFSAVAVLNGIRANGAAVDVGRIEEHFASFDTLSRFIADKLRSA